MTLPAGALPKHNSAQLPEAAPPALDADRGQEAGVGSEWKILPQTKVIWLLRGPALLYMPHPYSGLPMGALGSSPGVTDQVTLWTMPVGSRCPLFFPHYWISSYLFMSNWSSDHPFLLALLTHRSKELVCTFRHQIDKEKQDSPGRKSPRDSSQTHPPRNTQSSGFRWLGSCVPGLGSCLYLPPWFVWILKNNVQSSG